MRRVGACRTINIAQLSHSHCRHLQIGIIASGLRLPPLPTCFWHTLITFVCLPLSMPLLPQVHFPPRRYTPSVFPVLSLARSTLPSSCACHSLASLFTPSRSAHPLLVPHTGSVGLSFCVQKGAKKGGLPFRFPQELQPHSAGVQIAIHVHLCTHVTVVGVWVLLGSEICYPYLSLALPQLLPTQVSLPMTISSEQ